MKLIGPNLSELVIESKIDKEDFYNIAASVIFLIFSNVYVRYGVKFATNITKNSEITKRTFSEMQNQFVTDYYSEYPISRIINKLLS